MGWSTKRKSIECSCYLGSIKVANAVIPGQQNRFGCGRCRNARCLPAAYVKGQPWLRLDISNGPLRKLVQILVECVDGHPRHCYGLIQVCKYAFSMNCGQKAWSGV